MSSEILQPEITQWQGIEFAIKHPHTQLAILTVPHPQEEGYANAVDKIIELNLHAVDLLSKLPLKRYEETAPQFACAIIPQDDFLKATGIPSNYAWATICSRSVWRQGREDLVVASSAHAKAIDFDPTTPLAQLQETQVDVLREIVHEHLPTLRDCYLKYPSAQSLPISEAMDELVPRYILGFQAYMPKSKAFLQKLPETDLLTVNDLWRGFSTYSSNPIRTNRAYGSAFLLGLGLIKRIEKAKQANPREALNLWLEAVSQADSPKSAVNSLASLSSSNKEELWNNKTLQLEGQKSLGM